MIGIVLDTVKVNKLTLWSDEITAMVFVSVTVVAAVVGEDV